MQPKIIRTDQRGSAILSDPLLNKGTAFSMEERDLLGLHGLLPPLISTVDQQIKRCYFHFSQKRTPLEKYESLVTLMSFNEILFYQLILRYPAEVLPIIYTPTVGDVAMQYSRIFFHQKGIYLSYPLKDKIEEILQNHPNEVDVIVATDGERILGLGDQGIGGMAIPIGKLSLYTLFGSVHPARTLPIFLDVGTNNQELLKDEFYLGWRHERLSGAEYDAFIDRFVAILKKRFPKVLLQWEDFGKANARRLLDRYRNEILSFNDDIQGTAAVVLAALLAANRIAHQNLAQEKVAILGGGSAGTGIAEMIVQAKMQEGLSYGEALSHIYLIDLEGLIHFSSKTVAESQKPYVQPQSNIKHWKVHSEEISLFDVIANAKPSILIGVCAQGGAFTKEVIQEMARHVKRPILFPLSNPTTKAECTPDEAIEWTSGRAIIATGSPFPPVVYQGKTYFISQCNNVYIFPGLGVGAIGAKAAQITDEMLLEAARTLASFSPALKNETAPLFPPIEEVRSISKKIAIAVAKKAAVAPSSVEKEIDARLWEPHYPKILPKAFS